MKRICRFIVHLVVNPTSHDGYTRAGSTHLAVKHDYIRRQSTRSAIGTKSMTEDSLHSLRKHFINTRVKRRSKT